MGDDFLSINDKFDAAMALQLKTNNCEVENGDCSSNKIKWWQ
jgi:hypothetical protein